MNADPKRSNRDDVDRRCDDAETMGDDFTPATLDDEALTLGPDDTPPTLPGPSPTGILTVGSDSYSRSEAHVPLDTDAFAEAPEYAVHSLMIIEDDVWAARLLVTLIQGAIQMPLAFVLVHTLQEALARLKSDAIQLILTDLGLSDSAVQETVPRLREAAPDTPVIVLSAHDDDALRHQILEAGADAYLVKGEVSNSMIVSEILTRLDRLPRLDEPAE